MKKVISILLVVVLMITSLSAGVVGFAETYEPNKSAGQISIVAKSEKDTYAWGDELVFVVSATNNTGTDYENVKIRAQANKAKFFYDGESNTETIDSIKAGETKDIQIKVKASSPNVFQRMFILPIYYIIDFLSPMAFNANNYDATTMVKVGAFRYKFGFDVTDGTETDSTNVQDDIDSDGVGDSLEMLFGSDVTVNDTDGDGLSDYIEIYISGTYPTEVDSDENGIDDGYEDYDNDGINNLDELKYGTEINKADTDGDGLNDYDELFVYNTDPLKYDTDDDGICDGDEIVIGLNPLQKKSDGSVLDADRTFKQELSSQNISETLFAEENSAKPSLEATVSGNINKQFIITPFTDEDYSYSRAIVGNVVKVEPIDETTEEDRINAVLSFALPDFSVSECSNMMICRYIGETLSCLATEFDEASKTLSATIDSFGVYFVLDYETLVNELGMELPDSSAKAAPKAMAAPAKSMAFVEAKETTPPSAMAQLDVVFVIDTTGSMDDEISNVKSNIESFAGELYTSGISAALGLVEFRDIDADGYGSTIVHTNGSSNWFYNATDFKGELSKLRVGGGGDTDESVVDALETARRLDMRNTAGKVFILVTDAGYKVKNRYDVESMTDEISRLNGSGINCSVVTSTSYKSTYKSLYEGTGGSWLNIYGDFYSELIALATRISEDVIGDGYWILLSGIVPRAVCLDGEPIEGSDFDTDNDYISDIAELGSTTPLVSLDLDEVAEYVPSGLLKDNTNFGKIKMFSYRSDPTLEDTDFDGTNDIYDTQPKNNSFEGIMHYDYDKKAKTCNVEFNVNYKELISGSNTTYSSSLSILSSLLASDVYSKNYIQTTNGARVGGSDVGTNLCTLIGLNNVKFISVKSQSGVDTDDITDIAIGHKLYNKCGMPRPYEVIIVSVRGTNGTAEEWSSNFDVGADIGNYYSMTGNHPEWTNKLNHKGFDVTANRAINAINEYITTNVSDTATKVILVCGHSRGAAIANLVGKYYDDRPDIKSFTYTFAAPNCTTDSNVRSYKSIFNVLNADDLIPYLPLSDWGFSKYGVLKTISVADKYENKWGKAEEGTFEWLVGKDYNNDGGTKRTLSCFSDIADDRIGLYVYDITLDGTVYENNWGHTTQAGAQDELTSLTSTLSKERLLRFCKLSIVKDGLIYYVAINYCPAYLMQVLSNMTTTGKELKDGPQLGRDVRGKYAIAKASFVASSGFIPTGLVGGMTDPHMQPTYYLIAHNNFKNL